MGDALIVTTIPEEAWIGSGSGTGSSPTAQGRGRGTVSWPIDGTDVWEPPSEPTVEHGSRWFENPRARRAHRKAVQESLEEFLNERMSRLYHMVRTGWWVLGKVRVRVVECRSVPEREMRQLARSLRGRPGGDRARPRKKTRRKVSATPSD